jgi:pimeloyl-ACP methyl ester carboxylesterase
MKSAPVLMLHCSGSSGAQWRALAAKLGPAYRAIAPDLSAHATLEQAAAALAGTLRGIGEPAHLVGHSYGGGLALHLARTRPGLFRSLTLIEPSAFHLLRCGDAIDAAALREICGVAAQVRADLASGAHLEGFGRFVDYWSGPGAWDAMPAEKRAAFSRQLGNIALDFQALLGEPSGLEDLRGLSLPTLLLQGGRTQLPSRCVCKRLRDAHPGWTFRVVQGAGHMLPVTHRDAVNELIAEHFESLSLEREAA